MTMLVYKLACVNDSPPELWSLQVAGNTVRSFDSKTEAVRFGKQRVEDLTSGDLRVKLLVYRFDGSVEEEYSLK